MQERRNSIANALELRFSCINPIYSVTVTYAGSRSDHEPTKNTQKKKKPHEDTP